MNRRDFIRWIGTGTAAAAAGFNAPRMMAKTENGVLVRSESEYSGFLVEKMTGGKWPYEYKPEVLTQMREKWTIFSRNVRDPARQDRPEMTENLSYVNLVKGKGRVPNQTRLDYAFMSVAWHYARSGSPYGWKPEGGMGRMFDGMGKWDAKDF